MADPWPPRLDRQFERRLAALVDAREAGVLTGGLKGVEREALRVAPDGRISQKPHPRALGSTLTHPHITTDYSEALIELVTPPFTENWELQQYLCDVHQFVYRHLDDELLWVTSMPCVLGGDAEIPIAQFGSSNIGRMKHVYRVGLGLRYGRVMQAISGVHFNYSFPAHFWPVWESVNEVRKGGQEHIDESYFALLRNYRRFGWLILYLFGVSPAVCRSFFAGRDVPEDLQPSGAGTLIAPYATSLRMSDLGYRNKAQAGVHVSVNSLDEYVRDLSHLIATPFPSIRRTAWRWTASGGSSTPTCCRSRTSTTASSVPSASRCRASARPRRSGARASSTSRCARSTSAPTIRSASTSASSVSSRRSRRSACCARARRCRRRSPSVSKPIT